MGNKLLCDSISFGTNVMNKINQGLLILLKLFLFLFIQNNDIRSEENDTASFDNVFSPASIVISFKNPFLSTIIHLSR